MDDKFTIVDDSRIEERVIREDEREDCLRNYFGIICQKTPNARAIQ